MYKLFIFFLIAWLMGIGLTNYACAEETKGIIIAQNDVYVDVKSQALKPQTKDILSGKPINKNVYTDYNGKRIYFCCDDSKRQFSMDPETYIKAFQNLGITLEDVPAKTSGGEEKSLKITGQDTITGQDVVPNILDKKSQAPGIQTTDPVSNKPINKSVYTDYNGKRIYHCCEAHKKHFNEDPEKSVKNLQDQGIVLEDVPALK